MKKDLAAHNIAVVVQEQMRVASLNILNIQDLMPERLEILIKELKQIQPDILCLQEIITNIDLGIISILSENLGFTCSYVGSDAADLKGENRYANAILTKTPSTFREIPLGVAGFNHTLPSAIIMEQTFNNITVTVFSAHLAWGGGNMWVRKHQLEIIAREADRLASKNPQQVIILAGDLNEFEDSEAIQYMYGKAAGQIHKGTYWVDAWKLHGTLENKITVSLENKLAANTAEKIGFKMVTAIPDRRIDYIMSHGWVYGKAGYPLNFERFADMPVNGLTPSDHYGIFTDIYMPNNNS